MTVWIILREMTLLLINEFLYCPSFSFIWKMLVFGTNPTKNEQANLRCEFLHVRFLINFCSENSCCGILLPPTLKRRFRFEIVFICIPIVTILSSYQDTGLKTLLQSKEFFTQILFWKLQMEELLVKMLSVCLVVMKKSPHQHWF